MYALRQQPGLARAAGGGGAGSGTLTAGGICAFRDEKTACKDGRGKGVMPRKCR